MTSKGGSRITLPENALRVCARCGAERRNVRRGWDPIARSGEVVGWTCPECPRMEEPIRRVTTASGVRFRVVVDSTPPGARKRQQVSRNVSTLDEARAVVDRVRAEVAQAGAFVPPPASSVAALTDRWLRSRVDIREITREGYRGALAPVLRHIGKRNAASLNPTDARELVSWLSRCGGRPTPSKPNGRELSPRSVRAALVAFAQVLDMGVSDGTLTRNVARGVKRPRQASTRGTDLQHWQPDELAQFRHHADGDEFAAAWRLTLAGLTRADVLGLRWLDVNTERGTVTINQGRVQLQHDGQRAQVDEPKTAQRRRTVPVEQVYPGTVGLLRSLRARQAADRLKMGAAYTDTGLVVVDAAGVPLRPENYSDRFRRLCEDAGVPVIRLHSVRHSLAFLLHLLGVTPADAAALLGHTVEVHLSTYLPDSGSSGIATAAAALGRVAASAE